MNIESDSTIVDTTNVIEHVQNTYSSIENSVLGQLHEFLTIQLFNLQNTPVTIYSLIVFILFLIVFSIGARIFSRFLFSRLLGGIQMDEEIRFTLIRFTNYFTHELWGFFMGYGGNQLDFNS